MNIESRGEIPAEPVLVEHFKEIENKPDLQPKPEEFSNIFENGEYRKHCFQEANRAFSFVYDKEKLDDYLNADPSEEGRKYLKRVRRFGLILRAMYNFCDASHQSPERFHEFLLSLGKFNDRYWMSDSERGNLEDVSDPGEIEISADFCSDDDFKEFASRTLSQTGKFFEEPALEAKTFHTLRKNVRLFADFLQVATAENRGGKLQWLFASVLEVSVALGEKHDELVENDLSGEAKYDSVTVKRNKALADKFKKLEPFLKKITGIS